ncbi:hypothetical protein MKW98_022585 [Papaver atlanticum]|uniref:DUF4283 domain-containing protein n=1 Tax=Papaver atlanticum TaxID=357466 RepID=A0AAD4XHF5_9MAGN|nr:hypothetical protein MKW98_022585 [Papaver atlanticum]
MVNYNKTMDKEGFTTTIRRRSRFVERVPKTIRGYEDKDRIQSDLPSRQGKSIKVERKIIGGSMGKKGSRDIIHLAIWSGIRRQFCWLSFRAGLWLFRLLKKEASCGGGKVLDWNFREHEDWMLAMRKKNENGEFICLQVSHNKEYPSTMYFPAGSNGAGWWEAGEILSVKSDANAWSVPVQIEEISHDKPQKHLPLIKSSAKQELNSLWERTMVVEVFSNDLDWKEVGLWIMDKFGRSFGFDLQPIDDSKAVFTIKTTAEFSRVSQIKLWKVGDIEIHLYPWFTGINTILGPTPMEINEAWIGVRGIPFNLWDYSTFKAIGDKYGGLAEVFRETTMATDLSEVRMKINGPVSNGVWCEDLFLVQTKLWVEIRKIGEVLETTKSEMKPIFVDKDRPNFWRRRRLQGTGDEEEEIEGRGIFALVGSTGHFAHQGIREKVTEATASLTVPAATVNVGTVRNNFNSNLNFAAWASYFGPATSISIK